MAPKMFSNAKKYHSISMIFKTFPNILPICNFVQFFNQILRKISNFHDILFKLYDISINLIASLKIFSTF